MLLSCGQQKLQTQCNNRDEQSNEMYVACKCVWWRVHGHLWHCCSVYCVCFCFRGCSEGGNTFPAKDNKPTYLSVCLSRKNTIRQKSDNTPTSQLPANITWKWHSAQPLHTVNECQIRRKKKHGRDAAAWGKIDAPKPWAPQVLLWTTSKIFETSLLMLTPVGLCAENTHTHALMFSPQWWWHKQNGLHFPDKNSWCGICLTSHDRTVHAP